MFWSFREFAEKNCVYLIITDENCGEGAFNNLEIYIVCKFNKTANQPEKAEWRGVNLVNSNYGHYLERDLSERSSVWKVHYFIWSIYFLLTTHWHELELVKQNDASASEQYEHMQMKEAPDPHHVEVELPWLQTKIHFGRVPSVPYVKLVENALR